MKGNYDVIKNNTYEYILVFSFQKSQSQFDNLITINSTNNSIFLEGVEEIKDCGNL